MAPTTRNKTFNCDNDTAAHLQLSKGDQASKGLKIISLFRIMCSIYAISGEQDVKVYYAPSILYRSVNNTSRSSFWVRHRSRKESAKNPMRQIFHALFATFVLRVSCPKQPNVP